MATGLQKEIVNGKDVTYSGKIKFNAITNLSFLDRVRLIFGMEVLSACTLYTTSTHVNIVASDVDILVGNPTKLGRELLEMQTKVKKEGLFKKSKGNMDGAE